MTRYEDVAAVLKDKEGRFAKDKLKAMDPGQRKRAPWVPGFLKPLERNMLDLDDSDHARLCSLVVKAFTPRLVDRLRGRVESLSEGLLDAMERKGARRGRAKLVGDYALPLPAALSFVRYLRRLVERRRVDPGEDLITALIREEEEGDNLSKDEILAMAFLLLVAGHETTVNLISGGTLALLQHPEQAEVLRRNPSLAKPAIEELLRYTSPVEVATERYAREVVEIAGATIPGGELVLAVLGSANHDENYFEDPDTLELSRDPNRHLAFERGGVHHCLGAPLARMEGEIAMKAFLRRFPHGRLAVASETLRWRRGLFLRGLERLPVVLQ